MVEETTILHLPLRATLEDGCFLLELDDGNSLVHLGSQLTSLLVHRVAWEDLGEKLLAGVVLIGLEGKGGQRYEVDAVLLDRREVGIAQTESQHITDTGVITSRSTHPEDIVVAPLDIPRVILAQCVHDDMGSWTTIVDVAQDMQLVDGQTLDDVTDGHDEIIGTTCGDDGINDHTDIGSLVAFA